MKKAIIYIHGKGGNKEEAEHYKTIFTNTDIIGFDYAAQYPWEAAIEFSKFFDDVITKYGTVSVIANSIGAFFAMCVVPDKQIEKAVFISPIVNMEKLITDMMLWEKVSEEDLRVKKEIRTSLGEVLSWKYLCYLREHPVKWKIPTYVLYGARDHLTSRETISKFCHDAGASLTIMENGEHWFHTGEQIEFLDTWIRELL